MSLETSKSTPKDAQRPYFPLLMRLSALFVAVFIFVLSVGFIGQIASLAVESLYLRPEVVQALGLNPKSELFPGIILQSKAMQIPEVFPLYGSSEMSMITDYHPARVFTGEQGFTPFLVGKGGTQTIIHALNLAAFYEELRGRKIAIFLTPQWYHPGGISQATFAGNFSALHAYRILANPSLSPELKGKLAERILQFSNALKDFPLLRRRLSLAKKRGLIADIEKTLYWLPAKMEFSALEIQDAAKTVWYVKRLSAKTVAKYSSHPSELTLPNSEPFWNALRLEAAEEAKTATAHNPFGMADTFYFEHIQPKLKERKDSDKEAKLYPSPEYDDLNLLLQVLKEKGARPLFVIIPMNGRWYDYTGFPRTEREECYKRLAKMIRDEGFALADFSSHEYDEYYLRDPWHLAWKGWVDVDEALEKFYRQ